MDGEASTRCQDLLTKQENYPKPPTIEPLREKRLDPSDPNRKVLVGSLLSNAEREHLIEFLMNNKDVFAWSHVDMLGIDLSVACHRLNVDPNHPPHQ
ncbi:unnamed protein product [Prunus brigantina]